MLKIIIFIIALNIPDEVFCQGEKLSEIIIDVAEELTADDSDPEVISAFVERLHELAENPVQINSSREEEISRLFFLSDFQIKAIADYAHSSGKIISVYELANIPGFDQETVEMIIPFITLKDKTNISLDSMKLRNTLLINLIVKPGGRDTVSEGSPWKILSKYRFSTGGFSGGFTMEKDAGEKFFSDDPHQPDFFSAHLAYAGKGIIRRIIIGDFGARFGQGTNVNTSIRTGLSLTIPGYMSGKDEIKPYTSTDENNFFRGAAAEFSLQNLGLIVFCSQNKIDATLSSSTGLSNDYIENFYTAGLHNTPSLLMKKDIVSEKAYGINLSINLSTLKIGLAWSGNRFSLPVKSGSIKPEDIYDFKGERNDIYTIYYSSLIKRMLLCGEFSANDFWKYAFIQGLSFRPSDRLIINFLYRNYSPEFISFHGKGPGSGSVTGNEEGVLANFTFEAFKHLFISAGCDLRNFPWLKYRCSAPSWGKRQEVKVKYFPTVRLTIEASYNYRNSMVDRQDIIGIPEQEQIISKTFKGFVKYTLNDNFILGTRLDYKIANPTGSRGMLLMQDINYRFRSLPVSFWFRYCIFSTEDWESRLYTYENDLLYSFSIPALSGEGSRSYIMGKWTISDSAELRVKYGITSLIENGKSLKDTEEIKMQFRIRF